MLVTGTIMIVTARSIHTRAHNYAVICTIIMGVQTKYLNIDVHYAIVVHIVSVHVHWRALHWPVKTGSNKYDCNDDFELHIHRNGCRVPIP